MSSKTAKKTASESSKLKSVLAGNPLDLVLGRGMAPEFDRSFRTRTARENDRPRSDDRDTPAGADAQNLQPAKYEASLAGDPQRSAEPTPPSVIAEPQTGQPPGAATSEEVVSRVDEGHTRAAETSPAVVTPVASGSVNADRPSELQAPYQAKGEEGMPLESAAAPVVAAIPSQSAPPPLEQGRASAANDQAGSQARAEIERSGPRAAAETAGLDRADDLHERSSQLPSQPLSTATPSLQRPAASTPRQPDAKGSSQREQLRATKSSPAPGAEESFEESSTGTVRAVQGKGAAATHGADQQDELAGKQDELAGRGASFRHRIGTIQEPYVRADGTKVRQWSITLPQDLIRRVTHLAVDRGVKPAVLAQEALERLLAKAER